MEHEDFTTAINAITLKMKTKGIPMHRDRWQGMNVASRPDAVTYELHHETLSVDLPTLGLQHFRDDIQPNLPWADDHFLERVGGNPLNPGVEWANWPWGKSADKSRLDPATVGDPGPERVFDHTYAQRYWPKYAGLFPGGIIRQDNPYRSNRGIYFNYGDLGDVVEELRQDITTRQAILPVFFPEDTGYRPGRRKPCSLFYHFMMNGEGQLDISYQLRSCDLAHHFRDDIYLTVRLLLWVIDQLERVEPGRLVMQIANLHCFINDYNRL